jgi:CheY-like chemotaxis protein
MTVEDPVLLLVDDSANDTLLMRAAMEAAKLSSPLQCVQDGEAAIAYLGGIGIYRDRGRFPLPTAVLLDLKMSRRNGFEVLGWVREQPALQHLHVYVLTASSRADDIRQAYELGANSYLLKPSTLDGLTHLVRCLADWLKLSHFVVPAEGELLEFAPPDGSRAHAPRSAAQPMQ